MEEQRFELAVDRQQCGGSGMCVAHAPSLFELRDGIAMPTGTAANSADAILAQQTCPTEAISFRQLEA